MRRIFFLSYLVFVSVVVFSEYRYRRSDPSWVSGPGENFGFSHVGLFLTACYTSVVERTDLGVLCLVAAVLSLQWHSIDNMEEGQYWEEADEVASQMLIVYGVWSLLLKRWKALVASLAVCLCAVFIHSTAVILCVAFAGAVLLCVFYRVYWWDLIASSVFAGIAFWQYMVATSKSHAVWHACGAIAVGLGATVLSKDWHLLGLVQTSKVERHERF